MIGLTQTMENFNKIETCFGFTSFVAHSSMQTSHSCGASKKKNNKKCELQEVKPNYLWALDQMSS